MDSLELEDPKYWKYITKLFAIICVVTSISFGTILVTMISLVKSQENMTVFHQDHLDSVYSENKDLRISLSYVKLVLEKFVTTMRNDKYKPKLMEFGQDTIDDLDKTYYLDKFSYLTKYKENLEKEIKELKEQIKKVKNGNRKI